MNVESLIELLSVRANTPETLEQHSIQLAVLDPVDSPLTNLNSAGTGGFSPGGLLNLAQAHVQVEEWRSSDEELYITV